MKNPPFDSLVWGSLRLAPIILILCMIRFNIRNSLSGIYHESLRRCCCPYMNVLLLTCQGSNTKVFVTFNHSEIEIEIEIERRHNSIPWT